MEDLHTEVVSIELAKRIFSDNVDEVQKAMHEPTDFVLMTGDNVALSVHKIVLQSMSSYFAGLLESGMREATCNCVRSEFPMAVLAPVTTFMYTGFLSIDIKNCEGLFYVADYLQMQSLAIACQDYICRFASKFPGMVFELGMQFGRDEFLEAGMSVLERDLKARMGDDSFAQKLSAPMMRVLLQSNDLRIAKEDDAYFIFEKWFKAFPRTPEDVEHVVQSLRLPHLSFTSYNRLLKLLPQLEDTVLKPVRNPSWTEVTVDQLAKRKFANLHLHMMWCVFEDSNTRLLQSCLRCSSTRKHSKIYSHTQASSLNFDSQNRPKFISIGPYIMKVVVSESCNSIIVSSIDTLNRNLRRKTLPKNKDSYFKSYTIAKDGSKLVLSYVVKFMDPAKYIAIDTKDWTVTEDYITVSDAKFPPARMRFDQDLIFLQRARSVCVIHRKSGETTSVSAEDLDKEYQIASFCRQSNKLYVYLEKSKVHGQSGLMRILDLETLKWAEEFRVSFASKNVRPVTNMDGGSSQPQQVREVVNIRSEIYMLYMKPVMTKMDIWKLNAVKNEFVLFASVTPPPPLPEDPRRTLWEFQGFCAPLYGCRACTKLEKHCQFLVKHRNYDELMHLVRYV